MATQTSPIPEPTKTIVYKTVNNLEIPLDIYLRPSSYKAPILLWFHGGGLLQGRRDSIAPHMRYAPKKHNLAVISADYRLAPQATVAEIFSDVESCVEFIRNGSLASHLAPDAIDSTRLAVSGSSAGGYLALLAGLYITPKPNVIAPIYPITDPLGLFFTNPQPAPSGRYAASREELASYLDQSAPQSANCGKPPDDTRAHMYVYMLRNACLADLLGVADSEAAEKWRVARNIVAHGLPPSYVLHGDKDTAVGVEQSDEVVGVLVGKGGEVIYERPIGKDHFLDIGEDYENEAMYQFIMKYF